MGNSDFANHEIGLRIGGEERFLQARKPQVGKTEPRPELRLRFDEWDYAAFLTLALVRSTRGGFQSPSITSTRGQ
jgi:hypothetical protein